MRNFLLLLSISLLAFQLAFGQQGKVYDNLSMKSTVLNSERKFAIYLPPDYETSQRSYPVLYLLHGLGDDQTGWIQFGEVLHIADKAIKEGKATPMVIVMPDANTGRIGYFNDINGKWNYEDFFFKELIPYIEANYHVKKEKRYRAISGLSMGGGGTFMYALHHPEMFSSACPLSAFIGRLSNEEFMKELNDNPLRNNESYSKSEIQTYYEQHNALSLINKLSKEDLSSIRWFIDCGDDDFLYEGNSLVHIVLRKKEIPHEFRIRDGAHNWTYWRESLPVVLEFVSEGFRQL